MDIATAEIKRPSLAKIWVQVDLLKKLPHRIRLQCGESLPPFWQEVIYDKLPKYCKHCMRLRQDVKDCKLANPHLSEIHAKHESGSFRAKSTGIKQKEIATEQGEGSKIWQQKDKPKDKDKPSSSKVNNMSNGAGQTGVAQGATEAELRQATHMKKLTEGAPETTKSPKEVVEVEEEEEVFEEALDANPEVNINHATTVTLSP